MRLGSGSMDNNPEQSTNELDIAALAFRYLDRRLKHTQRKALNDYLRRDAAARSTFVRCLMQAVELEELLPEEQATALLQSLAAAEGETDNEDQTDSAPADRITKALSKAATDGTPALGLRLLGG